jgi:hypothetical protein
VNPCSLLGNLKMEVVDYLETLVPTYQKERVPAHIMAILTLKASKISTIIDIMQDVVVSMFRFLCIKFQI